MRSALGARQRDVLRLILRQGAKLAIAGSLIGVAGALLLRKIMASFLYGLSANDPLILCVVPCVMVLVIAVACWQPRRLIQGWLCAMNDDLYEGLPEKLLIDNRLPHLVAEHN
jgi:hypothetical protein